MRAGGVVLDFAFALILGQAVLELFPAFAVQTIRVAHGRRIVDHGANALQHAGRGFSLGLPDGQQGGANVFHSNFADRALTEKGIGICRQCVDSLIGMLGALPL